MPTATSDGVELYYETAGEALRDAADAGEAPVAFVNHAGYGAWVWSWQHAGLAEGFETLVWDLRGTGRSGAPPGPYDVRTLAADLEAVLSAAGVAHAHLVGAGLGGMVALEYAREYGRALSLGLFGTAPTGDRVDAGALEALFAPRDDLAALRASLDGAFAVDLAAHQDVADRIVGWRREEDADRAGFDAQTAAMTTYEGADFVDITTPTRVFHGENDAIVPAAAGRDLAEALPRGEFTAVDGGHLCFIEAAAAVNDELVAWLDARSP